MHSDSLSTQKEGMQNALKYWELKNSVISDDEDQIYKSDAADQEQLIQTRPWLHTQDVHYFKKVKLSAVALIKMVLHARSGGRLEIMGLMQGKILQDTFVIMDAFALPVEGTETRVNAGAEANEYMVNFQADFEITGRHEHIVGWYHSHPGYGCWLSGIDVQTQLLHQQHEDPFLAIVIDPIRTCSTGRVEIGAFRCYPAGYIHAEEEPQRFQQVPLEKIEDFGVHWQQYYKLPIEIFKSKIDKRMLECLWSSYWTSTLSSSTLLSNKEYNDSIIQDLVSKCEGVKDIVIPSNKRNKDIGLEVVRKQTIKTSGELIQGLSMLVLKRMLFNRQIK